MIKAIIFDFFGVICSDEYWQFVKDDKDSGGDFDRLSNNLNMGKTSWADFVQQVANDTGQDVEKVKRMYETQKIQPEMVAFIGRLRDKYKTALLTNANTEQLAPLIEGAGLKKIFDEIIISSEVGIAKPDPRIFQITLARLKIEPQEAIFIDDISRYTDAASAIGIKSIHYQNFPQMKKELDQLLYQPV